MAQVCSCTISQLVCNCLLEYFIPISFFLIDQVHSTDINNGKGSKLCNAVSEIFLGPNIETAKNKVSFANWNTKRLGDTGITSSMEEMKIRPIILYLFQGMVDC